MPQKKAHSPANAQNALSALAIVAENPAEDVHKLTVAAGVTKGAIYLRGTTIIGCSIGADGANPMESLDTLLQLTDASIAYFPDEMPSDCESVAVPISAVFAEKSSTAELKPAIGNIATQEITPEELEELAKATDLEFIIKRQQRVEETAKRQFESDKQIGDDTDGLTAEKRQDLEVASKFIDKDSFAQSDPKINAEPEKVDLESLKSAVPVDEKGFEETEVPIVEGEGGLSDEQRAVLDLAARMKDEVGFSFSDEKLAQQELAIPQSEKWMLEEAAKQLTEEEAKAQFEAGSAVSIDSDELVHTELTPEESQATTAELDSIPAPIESAAVQEGDRRALLPGSERLAARQREELGLIDRETDEVVNTGAVERLRRVRIDWQKYAGPVVLVSLCVALVTVPAAMKAAMYKNADQSITNQQVNAIVDEETSNSIAYASQDEAPQSPSGSGVSGSSGPQGAPSAIGEAGDDNSAELVEAQSLASRGFEAAAEDKYETYLAAHPMSVNSRLALIKLYIKTHKRTQARSHAIWGFKSNLPHEQRQEFYQLFKQCLAD